MMVHFDFIDACCSKSVVAGIGGSNIHWRDNERGRYLCRIHSMLCFSFQSNLLFCKHLLSRFLTMMVGGQKWADMVDDNQMDQMVDDQTVGNDILEMLNELHSFLLDESIGIIPMAFKTLDDNVLDVAEEEPDIDYVLPLVILDPVAWPPAQAPPPDDDDEDVVGLLDDDEVNGPMGAEPPPPLERPPPLKPFIYHGSDIIHVNACGEELVVTVDKPGLSDWNKDLYNHDEYDHPVPYMDTENRFQALSVHSLNGGLLIINTNNQRMLKRLKRYALHALLLHVRGNHQSTGLPVVDELRLWYASFNPQSLLRV